MTTYDWHHTYRTAVETYGGQTPGAELEQQLIDTFTHSPQTVTNAIAKASAAYTAGRITSPWGIVRSELNRISSQPNLTIEDTTSKTKAIARAEQWVRTTGLTLTQEEVIAHLFAPTAYTATVEQLEQVELETRKNPGRHMYDGFLKAAIKRTREIGPQPIEDSPGPLAPQDTPALRERILTIWRDNQDRARTQEADELERAETWKRQHSQARERGRIRAAELQAAQARERITVEPAAATAAPVNAAFATAPAPDTVHEEVPF